MTLKLSDVYKGNGYNGYVVASIISRDEEGYPDSISLKQICRTYKEAVEVRERLIGEDIIICPPFKGDEEILPKEAADYFRSFYGNNCGFSLPRLTWVLSL